MRLAPLILLAACSQGVIEIAEEADYAGTGWVDEPWAEDPPEEEVPDTSRYDGAALHIIGPTSGQFVTYDRVHDFEAELVAADGTVLEFEDIEWSSNRQPNWFHEGSYFQDRTLEVGVHAVTAEGILPNGDHVAHTVGGLLVQAYGGGTYAGIMRVNGNVQGLPISCTGASVVWVDQYGEKGVGNGECLVFLLALSVPLQYVFDLDITEVGVISGEVGIDLAGWFTYNFPAEGQLDPANYGIDATFVGDVPLIGTLSGSFEGPRVSYNSQPI